MIWRRTSIALLALCFAGQAFTGKVFAGNKNAGTSGAQFLKIGVGARAAGMGEAFTAVGDDVTAIGWNPAGLGRLTAPEFTAMHTQWFQDSSHEFLAAAYPAAWGTLGVALQGFTVENIPKRTADTDAPDGEFDSKDAAYTISYGKSLGEKWAAGANVKYIRQEIDGQTAGGAAIDLGALWQTPHEPLALGLSVRQLGGEMKFVDEGDPLPMTVTLGAAYKLWDDRVRLGLDVRQPNDNDLQFGLGGELTQPLFSDMSGSLRAGYNSAGTDPTDGLTGVSVGLGLAWRDWSFDTAWVPYGVLGQTFRYAFLIRF